MAKGTVNKVILLGRLGADPEVRYMPSGMSVANLRVATNDGYKDRQTGQFVENTEWHRVAVFGKQADVVSQYTQKGSLVYLEGRIRTNKWQDQNGQDRFTTEIIATEVQFVGGRSENPQGGQQSQQPSNNQSGGQPNQSSQQQKPDINQLEDFDDDDIPF